MQVLNKGILIVAYNLWCVIHTTFMNIRQELAKIGRI